jgi:hypothetical protein
VSHPLIALMSEVAAEIANQDERWGEQNHPDGTALVEDSDIALKAKALNDFFVANDDLTWRDILWEEVAEAFAEKDPGPLREELIQVAAVAIQWVAAIDRREG